MSLNGRNTMSCSGKSVLVIGGTGTLGKALVIRLLKDHTPKKVVVLSRDEDKQHQMKQEITDNRIEFRIGDIANYQSVVGALQGIDIVINTSALKHIPIAEQFPIEATNTNVLGVANIIRCIQEQQLPIETVIGISTDKACLPMCAYGMTKGLMEKLIVAANQDCPRTRFILMRSGNVLASRGSILPIFKDRIQKGLDISITDKRMTRLFITLDQMVDAVLDAEQDALPGEIYVPKLPSIRMIDIAHTMIDGRKITRKYIGIRPGERLHEPIISKEEMAHTYDKGKYYVIHPLLLRPFTKKAVVIPGETEYSSAKVTLEGDAIKKLLEKEGLMP
jgi:FlaA1/EpsC-like NDP-sugar epimerase